MSNFNVETASLQEAMDYAVMKIVEQGGRCLSASGSCMYGNKKGQHCAVGWLLDENDQELMDASEHAEALVKEYGNIPQILVDNAEAFHDLQRFHDAKYKREREHYSDLLATVNNIDTSAPHWQQWVDMGKAA